MSTLEGTLLKVAKQNIANQLKHSHVNAFVSKVPTSSILPRVHNVECRYPQGRLIAIKDNICTTDLPTTAASVILKSYKSPYDATVVKLLRDAGAIIAGKTNMDEFGMGSHTIHSCFGKTKMSMGNGDVRSAGGSSGGSAVAVATDQCWA
jgi:aspartyl-tRNA(Asn)/glutamyl-tRNA(Gln) amidotransferase subunit A